MRHLSSTVINIKHKYRLTNKQMADKLGVSMHTVQAWCTGRRNPSNMSLKHIESVFGNQSLEREQKKMNKATTYVEKKTISNEQLLINLQQEKIEYLQNKVDHYEQLLKDS